MKVLLLHQHFNTPAEGGAIRSYYLAKALVSQGMQVVVITGYNGQGYRVRNVEGIEVHYLAVAYENRYGFYRRSVSFIRYLLGAVKLAAKFRDADVCYAMSVPLTIGLAAKRIQKRFGIPFIFEVGDLWPDAPVQMGFIRNRWFCNMLYRLEKNIYRSADSIVALSPAIQSAIAQKVPGKKIHLIPNMGDTDFFKPVDKDPSLQRKFGVEGKFVVSYTGALGIANGLDRFLQCAAASQETKLSIHFLLCGAGAMLGHLQQEAERRKLRNLTILPFTHRDGVREILSVTDASFISYQPVPVLETGSPNKYFDGLAAGKLIVVNFGGWIRDEIENNCGIYAPTPQAFVTGISPFVESPELLKAYQQASRNLAEKKYSREQLSKAFATIFQAYERKR
ncbi:glycosyltransferase family 4 protein [Fulvivirgaceae bacterium PWU4]|uniref:Glycosyltransferase family 4 protein n=1 Tax=Chryseosolibacter histidini TaxID=2782349 RepID=A0AAP2DKN2_9BACT|nr:glycosyltransferase family 4 protein [Chryseosolibacter histidini]MBT1697264.1 glycosyltransferase family 4 protein [Chryseosolibacter histidini]